MSRTGSFGRLPRAMPSITNTLVSIAREEQNQRDQTIMDAWQKGGVFEGKKVTDEMVLAHWHDRMQGISKDDPLYDTYKDLISQTEYTIAESKMTAKYALNPKPDAAADRQMSAFYLGWAKKVPKDSEFYRVLQRDAGQYIRSAQAKQDAKVRVDHEAIYQKAVAATQDKYEANGDYILNTMTQAFQRDANGAFLGQTALGDKFTINETTNIETADLPSVDKWQAILQQINDPTMGAVKGGPDDRVKAQPILFYDERGKPVTRASIIQTIRKSDPTFDGNLNIAYINKQFDRSMQGMQKRYELAKKSGHVTDMQQVEVEMAKMNQHRLTIDAKAVESIYSQLHTQKYNVQKDTTLLPPAKAAALAAIDNKIGALADDPSIRANGHLRAQLTAEAKGDALSPTVYEDMNGLSNGGTLSQDNGKGEIANNNAIRAGLDETVRLISDPSGQYVLTQGEFQQQPDGSMELIPKPGGKDVGAALATKVVATKGAAPAISIMVPNGDGRGYSPMLLIPAPITATATDAHGTKIKIAPGADSQVGSFVEYAVNGVKTRLFSTDGWKTSSSKFPGDPNLKITYNEGGAVIDLSSHIPADVTNAAGQGSMPAGWAVINKHAGGRSTKPSAGEMVFNPRDAVLNTAPEKKAVGFDPNTDSVSPTIAGMMGTPEGAKDLKALANNDVFIKIVTTDAQRAAGMTPNPDAPGTYTGTPQQQADAAKFLGNSMNILNLAKNDALDFNPSNPAFRDSWQRDMPANKLQPMTGQGALSPLASTMITATADDRFGKLGQAFDPNGSGQLAAANGTPYAGLNITMGHPLTIPGYDNSTQYTPPKTTGPTTNPYTAPATAPVTAPKPGNTTPTFTSGYTPPATTVQQTQSQRER